MTKNVEKVGYICLTCNLTRIYLEDRTANVKKKIEETVCYVHEV